MTRREPKQPGNGTRPPFPKGNTLALQSGGYRSPRIYGDLAEQLAAGLVDDRPDLAAYPEAVASWATLEAQAALLRRHLALVGALDDDGTPREALLKWLTQLERGAERGRDRLGLDPRAEAALARERAAASVLAVDLEGIAARGAEILQQRSGEPRDLAGETLAAVAADGARTWKRAVETHNAEEIER